MTKRLYFSRRGLGWRRGSYRPLIPLLRLFQTAEHAEYTEDREFPEKPFREFRGFEITSWCKIHYPPVCRFVCRIGFAGHHLVNLPRLPFRGFEFRIYDPEQ